MSSFKINPVLNSSLLAVVALGSAIIMWKWNTFPARGSKEEIYVGTKYTYETFPLNPNKQGPPDDPKCGNCGWCDECDWGPGNTMK